MEVLNTKGEIITEHEVNNSEFEVLELDIPSGVYKVRVCAENEIFEKRIFIEKHKII